MRLDINSADRLGITQEILSVLADQGWNLLAMEMVQFHTFVHIDEASNDAAALVQLSDSLLMVEGVTAVKTIDYLPSEQKRRHLDALLTKLPDPIVDVSANGEIMASNLAAQEAFSRSKSQLERCKIHQLTGLELATILDAANQPSEVIINHHSFLMDVTPVAADRNNTGALIIFQRPERLGQQLSAIQQQGEDLVRFIGQSVKIKAIKQQTIKYAAIDLPVLINGETGTGKELVARALHDSGPRAGAPFLAINCATFSENLLESELFGYAAGAFTGAQRGGKPGLLELAENGTVFLDEIGEMSIYLQAKLLRFMQDYTFRRIGGNNEIKANVRIVCATHRDLEKQVSEGEFREDLFYRLNVLNIVLPPLRERTEDIPELVQYFARHASEQLNCQQPTFSNQAIERMTQMPWPGNIRQLQNVLFRTLASTDKRQIEAQDLCYAQTTQSTIASKESANEITSLEDAIAQFEKDLLKELYVLYPSTRKLAHRLGVSAAKISRKLNRYKITK